MFGDPPRVRPGDPVALPMPVDELLAEYNRLKALEAKMGVELLAADERVAEFQAGFVTEKAGRLAAETKLAALENGRVLTCVFCAKEYPQGTPAAGAEVLTEHIKVCEKHPMRELQERANHLHDMVEDYTAALRKAEDQNADLRGDINAATAAVCKALPSGGCEGAEDAVGQCLRRIEALVAQDEAEGLKAEILEAHEILGLDPYSLNPIGIVGTARFLKEELDRLTKAKHDAYAERDKVVALAAKLAVCSRMIAWLGTHDAKDKALDPAWRNIVFIALPKGQLSWHIHDDELPWFAFLKRAPTRGKRAKLYKWDGHTTDEKYERIRAFVTPPKGE